MFNRLMKDNEAFAAQGLTLTDFQSRMRAWANETPANMAKLGNAISKLGVNVIPKTLGNILRRGSDGFKDFREVQDTA